MFHSPICVIARTSKHLITVIPTNRRPRETAKLEAAMGAVSVPRKSVQQLVPQINRVRRYGIMKPDSGENMSNVD